MAKLTSSVKRITPALAKQMLESNTGNFRPVDMSRVKRYSLDMKSGSWMTNGEALKFCASGMLLDGQHRLHAIVLSGIGLDMLVIEGLDEGVAISMDKGASRSVASWLRHRGIKNATQIGAIARQSLIYDKGLWSYQAVGAYGTTDAEVIDHVEHNLARIETAYQVVQGAKRFVNASILATIMLKAAGQREVDECDLCVWFSDKLSDGQSLTAIQPVYHLRNRLTTAAAGKVSSYIQRGLATMAWNKTALNESCRVLQFRINGDNPSRIPETIELCP